MKKRICKIDSCNNEQHAKGYCSKHYQRFKKYKDPLFLKIKEPEFHGLRKTPEYNIWATMIQRCNNINEHNYNRYGGRGIRVCSRWRNSFIDFYNDMGKRPSNYVEIDRIDNNGNYEPSNCRWITHANNCHNTRQNVLNCYTVKSIRRLYNMHKYSRKELSLIYNIKIGTLDNIIYNLAWIGIP